MSEQRLKPCPFCGSHERQISWIGEMAYVHCDKCGGSGGFGASPAEARAVWNQRVGVSGDA